MQRKKEKRLKPSLRENKRYLEVEGSKEEIEKAILDYIGILGYAKAGVVFVVGKLAINREEVDKVRAALGMAGMRVKKISGTLKSLE